MKCQSINEQKLNEVQHEFIDIFYSIIYIYIYTLLY